MDSDEISATFPWWATADDEDPEAPRKRALAWLLGPYAKVAAGTRFPLDPSRASALLELVRRSIDEGAVPPWSMPTEFEAWLRGVLQGCATVMTSDPLD